MHLKISTIKKDQVIDITDIVQKEIQKGNINNGLSLIFAKHTTCAITTADLDPETDLDLLEALRKLLPNISYRHPHDPSHTPDHILSSIIGPSLSIPFYEKKLLLGIWQRIILIELDGPRERSLELSLLS